MDPRHLWPMYGPGGPSMLDGSGDAGPPWPPPSRLEPFGPGDRAGEPLPGWQLRVIAFGPPPGFAPASALGLASTLLRRAETPPVEAALPTSEAWAPRARLHRPRVIDVEPVFESPARPASRPRRKTTSAQDIRILFRPPGRRLDIRWGDFRRHLESQVECPEELGPDHRLPVLLQVFEVRVPMERRALQRRVIGAGPLEPLTPAVAEKLGLGTLAGRVPEEEADPSIDGVRPGDRFFSLNLLADPTGRERHVARTRPTRSTAGFPADRELDPRQASELGLGGRDREEQGSPSVPEERIPRRYRVPWEFVKTREEVLYDLNAPRGVPGAVAALGRWARSRFGRTRRMRRWQALLTGKPPEEQLWGVRPPRFAFVDGQVLEWAERTLAASGLDPAVMLDEWEVYWRRKGV